MAKSPHQTQAGASQTNQAPSTAPPDSSGFCSPGWVLSAQNSLGNAEVVKTLKATGQLCRSEATERKHSPFMLAHQPGEYDPIRTNLNNTMFALAEARVDGLNDLIPLAEKSFEPPLFQHLLVEAALLSVSLATGRISDLVAKGLVNAGAHKFAADLLGAIMSKVFNDYAVGTLKAQPGANAVHTFFHQQRDFLRTRHVVLANRWNTHGYPEIVKQENHEMVLIDLQHSLEAAINVADDTQRAITSAEWANYLARAATGAKPNQGIQLGDALRPAHGAMFHNTHLPQGVLHLDLVDDGPWIRQAFIPQFPSEMSAFLAGQTVEEMGLAFIAENDDISIGQNERGAVWNRSSPTGTRWMADRVRLDPAKASPQAIARAFIKQHLLNATVSELK